MQAKTLPCTPFMYIAVSNNEKNEDFILYGRIWSPSGLEPMFRMWHWELVGDNYFIFCNKLHARLIRQKECNRLTEQLIHLRKRLLSCEKEHSDMYLLLQEHIREQISLFENAQIVKI